MFVRNQPMNFVEQFRDLLDFVNNNQRTLVCLLQRLTQQSRALSEAIQHICLKQIKINGIGKLFLQQGSLPSLPCAKQENTFVVDNLQNPLIHSTLVFANICKIRNTTANFQ